MMRWVLSCSRFVVSALALLIVLGTAGPIGTHAVAGPATRRPIDLAAMVPHPLDIPGGLRMGTAYLHTDFVPSNDNPLFVPAQWGSRLNERTVELLRRSGWQRTYTSTIAIPEPVRPDNYGQTIRFGVSEFAGEDQSAVARDGLAAMLREVGYDVNAVVLAPGSFATLATYHYPEGDSEPYLIFNVGPYLATVEFFNSLGTAFTATDVVLVGNKFRQQIETVIAGPDSTIGGYVLRLREGDHLRLTNEWYLRRHGRDLPKYLEDRETQVLTMALGEATDVYSADSFFTGEQSMTAVQIYLFRFPSEAALQSWLPLWQLYVTIWSWDQTDQTVDGIPADRQMVFSLSEATGERWSGNLVVAWSGREAVMVNVIGLDSLRAVSTLAKAQLDCLRLAVVCEPISFPPTDTPESPLPQASPDAGSSLNA